MYTFGRLARPSDEATLRTHAAVGAARLRPDRPPTFRGGKRSRGNERDYDDAACDYDGGGDSDREPSRSAAAQPDRRTHQQNELQKEKHLRRQLPFWLSTQRHLSPARLTSSAALKIGSCSPLLLIVTHLRIGMVGNVDGWVLYRAVKS